MSILNCILSKFKAQKPTFANEEGDQVSYKSLSQEGKDKLQKAGYITDEQLGKIQNQIKAKTDSGMSELQAAQEVHQEMFDETNKNAYQMFKVNEAINRGIADIEDARARGAKDNHIAAGFWSINPGQDALRGAIIASGNRFKANVNAWQQRLGSLLDPVLKDGVLPKSLVSMPSVKQELEFAKAIWGEPTEDSTFSGAASKFNKFIETAEKDVQAVGRSGYSNPDSFKGMWSNGEKIRGDLDKYKAYVKPELFDWSYLQKKFPGQYVTDADKANALTELRESKTSEGLKRPLNDITEADLPFKDVNDWMNYQQQYGQGSVLGVMNRMLSHYSREYAIGKTFGGNPTQFRDGILNYFHSTNEAGFDKIQKTFDSQMRYNMASQDGNIDNLATTGSKILKDTIVASNIGFAGVASAFHTVIGGVAASSQGLPSGKIIGGTFSNFIKSVITPEQFKAFQGELAKGQINADAAIKALDKTTRQQISNPIAKFYANAANAVSTFSGLANMGSAAKATQANVIKEEMARFLSTNEKIDPSLDYLRRSGFKDEDADALRPYVFDNMDTGYPVKDINFGDAYNSGDSKVIDATTKLHTIIDKANQALFPHSYDAASDVFNSLRKSGAVGTTLANMIQPLTGYMLGFYGNVLKPTIMTSNNRIGSIATLTSAMLSMGAAQVQIRRLFHGEDPLPIGQDLYMNTLKTTTLGPILTSMVGNLGSAHHADASLLDAIPGARPITDVGKLIGHGVQSLAEGKETHFARDGLKVFDDLVPGKSLPIVSLLYQHLFRDPLFQVLDPAGFARSVEARQQSEAQSKSGSWWGPGQSAPSRAPNLTQQ